jgi:hypothetical protein
MPGRMGRSLVVAGCAALILLGAPTARAEEPIEGHMEPLASELLAQPVALGCGAVIREWRGSAVDAAVIQNLEDLCARSLVAFRPFLARHGLAVVKNHPFTFQVSLIPDEHGYRGLNDRTYRFRDRPGSEDVWGYTSYASAYFFMLSDPQHPAFARTFVHELFHALSWHHGVFAAHAGAYAQKLAQDEALARLFADEILSKRK